MNSAGEVTRLLHQWNDTTEFHESLATLVYTELRRIASAVFRGEHSQHTLQPTALANEAYVRLSHLNGIEWKDRQHFFALAATLMRRVLVDHARARMAGKRGGGLVHEPFEEAWMTGVVQDAQILALHDALTALQELDPRQARIVELRFFTGLTDDEIADVLCISTRTVKRDWRVSKAWLYRELAGVPARSGN